MKYNRKGDVLTVAGKTFTIGSKIVAIMNSEYLDWEGILVEVRTDSDIEDKKNNAGEAVVDFVADSVDYISDGDIIPVSSVATVLSISVIN